MEKLNKKTGELEGAKFEKLNQVIIVETIRADGSRRIQQDFSNCPTMAEQHTAHLTNINYLMEKYKPDELAAYLAARNQYRQEILGHDFSSEPDLQEARNIMYNSRQQFEQLPDEIKSNFLNHVEFLKFIDNPDNVEKMVKMGIMTKRQIDDVKIPETDAAKPNAGTTTTQEAKDPKK